MLFPLLLLLYDLAILQSKTNKVNQQRPIGADFLGRAEHLETCLSAPEVVGWGKSHFTDGETETDQLLPPTPPKSREIPMHGRLQTAQDKHLPLPEQRCFPRGLRQVCGGVCFPLSELPSDFAPGASSPAASSLGWGTTLKNYF